MNVKDFYDSVEGNYSEVFAQLGDDQLIVTFLQKFFALNEIENLKSYINDKNYNQAFICAHNIKGFGLNLALPMLHKSADSVCNPLRNGPPKVDLIPLVNKLEIAYNNIQSAFNVLLKSY